MVVWGGDTIGEERRVTFPFFKPVMFAVPAKPVNHRQGWWDHHEANNGLVGAYTEMRDQDPTREWLRRGWETREERVVELRREPVESRLAPGVRVCCCRQAGVGEGGWDVRIGR